MVVSNDVLDRFYNKLDSIDNELRGLTRSLTITIERQNITAGNLEKLTEEVALLKAEQLSCPARQSHLSFGNVFSKLAVGLALFLSTMSVLQILWQLRGGK